MIDFDRIVDDAFSRLEVGEPIEAVLNRYPQQAEALRPLLETVSLSLHAYAYTKPVSPAGMARGRQRFLSEAGRRAEKHRARQRPLAWPWPARRWAVTVLALMLLFLAAGTTAVVASADSLPGSPLYSVKIAAEEVRLTLTRAPEPRARLHMARAQRRTQELNALLTQEAPVGGDLLVSSLNEAEAALRELSRVPAELQGESLEAYAAFATEQANALDQARDRMTPAQQPLLQSTADQYRRLADLARSAQTNPGALTPPPTTLPWPTPAATPAPTSTRPRPTGKATEQAGPAAITTRRPPSGPTSTPTRRVRPTNATPTPTQVRLVPLQTPASAVTPAGTASAAATLSIRPTRTGTARPSIHPPTPTLSPTAVRRPTRTATRTPRPVVTAVATPRPHWPSPTPTATRRKPQPTPTPTRHRPTPTATRRREPTPTPTHERDLTPTPTQHNTRPTPTRQADYTPTPPAVATAIPTANLPALPTPTPPSAVATAAPTAALPAFPPPTPMPALAP